MSDTDEAVIALERKTRARNLSEIDRRTGPDGAIGICCHMHKHLRRELALYDEALAARPEIVVLNKIDLPDTRKRVATLRKAFASC